jgi:hypothetical protein
MDIIKGLLGGLFHYHVCGAEPRRKFAKSMKPYLNAGSLLRDIQGAPRDGRYKIDIYHAPDVSINESLNYNYLGHVNSVLHFLGIDEAFDPRVLNNISINFGDFTLGKQMFEFGGVSVEKYEMEQYVLMYKGNLDTLNFDMTYPGRLYKGTFVDEYKDKPTYLNSFSDLIYQVRHYMSYYNLGEVNTGRIHPILG